MSQPYNDWKVNTHYTFTTAAPGVLPAQYTDVAFSGQVSYSTAAKIGSINIYAQWRQIFPLLPPGTPDTPESADWYIFDMPDGSIVVLAAPWIDGGTVTPISFQQFDIALTQSNYTQMTQIRDFLNKIGAKFQITERL